MTEIRIRNFQSIADLTFSVDGFTVVCGKNNIGKSAIVRAIDSALTNQAGDNYIRLGKKACEVSFKKDALSIEWKKGDTATYIVNGESFSKLNRAVPKPILDAGFREIEIGDKKKSPLIAPQFDEIFLLDKSGPIVTEVLSKLYHLDELSTADELCQKDLRTAKSSLKTKDQDLVDLNKKLEKFIGFDALLKDLAEVKRLDAECETLKRQIAEIIDLKNRLETSTHRVKTLKKVFDLLIPSYDNCEQQLEEYQEIGKFRESFNANQARVSKLQEVFNLKIPKYGDFIDLVTQTEALRNWNDALRPLATTVKKRRALLKEMASLEDLAKQTESTESLLKDLESLKGYTDSYMTHFITHERVYEELRQTTDQLNKAQEEMTTFKVCPLCQKAM